MIDSITPATTARTVTGSLVAVPVRGVTPATWRGSYQIPFSTAGLGPDGAPLLARRLRSDSIRIILNPDVSHGHAELVGGWRGGLLEGSWRWIGDPARAAGRFSLRPEGR